jgi:hypothetical protein
MAVTISGRIGYGQLEDNHLSAKRDGRVYAQLPAAEGIDVLEQGQFVKLDAEEVNFTADGPWYLVYNEERLYDERHQMHRDFAQKREDQFDGKLVPRCLGLVPGDTFTTNTLADGSYAKGDTLVPGTDGILAAGTPKSGEQTFKVVAETTMPDGQPAVKIRVIA